jgi:NADPH:quinone reductase-like Zn-dependent oxidoreductase
MVETGKSRTMEAVRVHRYGGPEVLVVEEIPIPEPAPGQVLVRVAAAGVGPWDALVRSGKSGIPQTLPLTPGSDIAGVVERLGNGDARFVPGDHVYGVTNVSFTNGYAQYALATAGMFARKPEGLGFIDAASAPVVAVTAWQMLFDFAHVAAGQRVLVHGAAGNVGAYAVQLAQWAGAHVIAVADARDAEFVRSLGADEVIDYRTQHFEDVVKDVDVVIDVVGGEMQQRSFAVLKRGGMLVSSVSQPSEAEATKRGVRVAYFIVNVTTSELQRIANLFDDGTIATNLGIVLPLRDARRAHEMLAGNVPHPRGKIVLEVAKLNERS